MKTPVFYIFTLLMISVSNFIFSQEDCPFPTAVEILDINNAGARYNINGSDWNNQTREWTGYEIPIGENTHSIFAGGMWIAGKNSADELKVNIRMFLQDEHDRSFRAGPMNHDGAGNFITAECSQFDHIYKINRSEVILHRLYFEMMEENGGVPPSESPFDLGYTIPEDILNWPTTAEVIPGQPQDLAPYFDNECCGGTPGVYEPELGDYPAFRFPDNEDEFDCEKHLLGDQALWWVVNDAHGAHGAYQPLGIEIHNMAYAFITNDHLNNTTFLRRTIINRSHEYYTDTYLGQFIDVDLGGALDDHVGADVERGMAYFYNGDIEDQDNAGAHGYGISPPAIGFDFVGGPLADLNDGIDNNFNGIIDEEGERLRMDYAVYYNNDINPITGNPSNPNHYYNYLQGVWKNGNNITYGGNGTDPDGIPVQIMFPGDSDPLLINTNGVPVEPWSEITENNAPGDRRQVISSGPFSMAPDEEKIFTLAIPWAREEGCEEEPCSLDLLREADDLAQELHNNCYELPCMVLEAQFEIQIENGQAFFSSNITSGEEYHWTFGDGTELTTTTPFASHEYDFAADIEVCLEIDYGCGSTQTCKSIGGLLSDLLTGPELTQIEGTGNTHHFFELTEETISAIMANDSNMVIHPTYKKGKGPVKVLVYDIDAIVEGDYTLQFDGTDADAHWKLFIQGSNDTIYSDLPIGTPNAQFIEEWGLMVSVDAHLSETESEAIGSALKFEDEEIPWLNHVQDLDGLTYQNWIKEGFYDLPCLGEGMENCFYTDETQTVPDYCLFSDLVASTADESFENMISGGWAPGYFVRKQHCHPFFDAGSNPSEISSYFHGQVRNVDIILTPDKSLWTRSPIIDLQYGEDVSSNLQLRDALSVDKNGRNQTHPDCNVDEATYYGQQVDGLGMSHGMGWFPGYAIDVNTGKRLNILFGENPDLVEDNGNDMIWNPTSTMWNEDGTVNFGGSHSIVILSNHYFLDENEKASAEYDGGQAIFDAPSAGVLRTLLTRRRQQWTGLPLLNEGYELLPIEEGLIPTETTIQLRLRHRYQNYLPDEVNINNGNPLYNFTIDYEDLVSEVVENTSPHILIYPNPANELLNIRLTDFEPGTHTARIFNLKGQLIHEERVISHTINAINISGLSGGVYILRLDDQENKPVKHARFVVVR